MGCWLCVAVFLGARQSIAQSWNVVLCVEGLELTNERTNGAYDWLFHRPHYFPFHQQAKYTKLRHKHAQNMSCISAHERKVTEN